MWIGFGLHGVLLDSARVAAHWPLHLGDYMAAHYGGAASAWADAWAQVVADWDSYHADLNYSGDEGLADVREGQFRVVRALFRLLPHPEPPPAALHALAAALYQHCASAADMLYADVAASLRALAAAGHTLIVSTHLLEAQARAFLLGGGVAPYISTVYGMDTLAHFERDRRHFARITDHARLAPAEALLVDVAPAALEAAQACGWRTLWLQRPPAAGGDLPSLADLPARLP